VERIRQEIGHVEIEKNTTGHGRNWKEWKGGVERTRSGGQVGNCFPSFEN